MLATVQNFGIKTVRIWHIFMFIILVMVCVLCKILVFVLKIADAIKPTRKKERKKRWKKSIAGILIWEILFSSTWIQPCLLNTYRECKCMAKIQSEIFFSYVSKSFRENCNNRKLLLQLSLEIHQNIFKTCISVSHRPLKWVTEYCLQRLLTLLTHHAKKLNLHYVFSL